MIGTENDSTRRRRLLRTLGVLTALVILTLAAAIVGITSFEALQSREQTVLDAWDEVRNVHDERLVLVARLAESDSLEPALGAALDRLRLRQRDFDAAPDFEAEVGAQAQVDGVFALVADLVERLPGTVPAPGRAVWRRQLGELNQAAAVARRLYNEAVDEYEENRHRLPHRWFARLFGYGPLPRYVPPDED